MFDREQYIVESKGQVFNNKLYIDKGASREVGIVSWINQDNFYKAPFYYLLSKSDITLELSDITLESSDITLKHQVLSLLNKVTCIKS